MKGLLESLFHVVSELIRETERVPGGTRFCFGLQKKIRAGLRGFFFLVRQA